MSPGEGIVRIFSPVEEAVADSNVMRDELDTTMDLVALAKAGHPSAIEMLYRRCLPSLRVWARGRLPGYARDLSDTQDLVQETLVHTLTRLDAFEVRGPGGLQAYLRRGVLNRICDEIRRATRRPGSSELVDFPDRAPSALEQVIGREVVKRYEAALARLSPGDQAAIASRLEGGRTYDDIAGLLGKPNANAARMAVFRAIKRLIAEMNDDGTQASRIPRNSTPRKRSSSESARQRA